ncbi:MAG: hypothetical protein JXR37_32245 [Kiritimatiellae bacterium]|nr:hypothetical protein [Kiritimatiellia bacterium]
MPCEIIPLDRVTPENAVRCGPKAASLARLIALALPVPPGFCVTAGVWRAHLAANGLTRQLEDVLALSPETGPDDTRRRLAAFRSAIVEAPVPPAIRTEIATHFASLHADSVAVRSSSTAEDLPGHSFAGQHDTFLGLTDLESGLDAVKKCWASLWTERAFEYRARNRIAHADAEMAVIVQALVPADAAGVIFTADPVTGDRDRIIVESTIGLGEPLVAGKIAPDRIVLAGPELDVLENRAGQKPVAATADDAGRVREQTLAPEQATSPSLEPGMARRLARLARKCERQFGYPLDIEFAVANAEPFLLQARPITNLPPAAPRAAGRQIWTNANTGEVVPDVVTPMSWSLMEPIVNQLITQVLRRFGMRLGSHPGIGLVCGRAYFNLNMMLAINRRAPGLDDEAALEIFGGRHAAAMQRARLQIGEQDIPKLHFSPLRLLVGIPRLLYEVLTFSAAKGDAFLARLKRQADKLDDTRPSQLSNAECVTLIESTFQEFHSDAELLSAMGIPQCYPLALQNTLRKWLGEEGQTSASRLLMGLGANDSANAGLALWQLAQTAHDHPPLEAALLEAAAFETLCANARKRAGGSQFLERWNAFMRTHGHHCRGELELRNARWAEQPDYVLNQVKSYVRALGADDFGSRYERLAAQREETRRETRRKLRNPLKRMLFAFLCARAQTCAPLRETLKSHAVRRLAVIRALLLELDRRLRKEGKLEQPDDVFFLRVEELRPLITAPGQTRALRKKIAERRTEYDRNQTVTPPPVVVGDYDPNDRCDDEPPDPNQLLTGIAVNPGVVTGPARVILRAGDEHVLPGEILVAPFTDSGWTPYFLNAAGIVMDMGGLLSHGCIIAREYGIPAVVNVGPATKIIKTGQNIQVDGTRGTVRILREDPTP